MGRAEALAALERAGTGDPQRVLVEGEAGIGKTALVCGGRWVRLWLPAHFTFTVSGLSRRNGESSIIQVWMELTRIGADSTARVRIVPTTPALIVDTVVEPS
ncbi:hypothetical protein ACQ86D_41035 [Streptomyces galilaeus]